MDERQIEAVVSDEGSTPTMLFTTVLRTQSGSRAERPPLKGRDQ
jgi:hypothetical protein